MRRFTALLLSAVMLLTVCFSAPFSAYTYDVSQQTLDSVSLSDWMSVILDDTKLTEITLPGTHDSCARKFKGEDIFGVTSGISKCQSMNITEQLNAGVRFLDIRCEVDPNSYSVKTVHGETDCWNGDDYYYLDFVFQDIYNWLDAHPSETVYVCIKEDYGDNGVPSFTNAIYEYIHGYGQGKYFYGENYNYHDKWYLGKSVPTLGQVRGKCVLFNRFDQYIGIEGDRGVVVNENESGQKIKYNDYSDGTYKEPVYEDIYSYNTGIGTAHIQDFYKWNTESKIRATQYMLNTPHRHGEYYINYSSTVSDSSVPNPKNLSEKVNPSYYSFNYTRNKPSGIYAMDFATSDLARQIVLNNEAVCSVVNGTDGNINYSLNRITKTLTISGNGAMNNYAYTSAVGAKGAGSTAPWGDEPKECLYEGQYNTDLIENLVIEEGVTSIGDYAFYGFNHISNITIPSSIASIGEGAFARCTAIKSLDISGADTVSIGASAFLGCTKMERFTTADSVSSIGQNAFSSCPMLTIYGNPDIYTQSYAEQNSIPYSTNTHFYSINTEFGNFAKESDNPFKNKDLSDGVTIKLSKYCNSNDDWNSSLLSFSTGNVSDNRYFIIMANGSIFFNDGNGGAGGENHCYFDIRSSNEVNSTDNKWHDIAVTIHRAENGNHILRYYVDSRLAKTYNLNRICADGYPYGVSGNDGIFSYLASRNVKLFYGSSFTIYGSMGGTKDSYIDDVAFYTKALSAGEIGALTPGVTYEEYFDSGIGGTANQRQSNDGTNIAHQTENDGRFGTVILPYSDAQTSNYISTDASPFANLDTSNGFTVSFFQRVNGNLWLDQESITFAQGDTAECKYFTIGTEGYIRYNNGNGGTDSSLTGAGLYFDCLSENIAITKGRWQLVTVSIISDRHIKVYVDGSLSADIYVNGTDNYNNTGGLLNFLASGNTKLYYGSYTPYWGTDTISLDNVKCFDYALSESEAASLYRYECESGIQPVFSNTFGADTMDSMHGFCEWQYGFGEKRGVLHFNEGAADGSVDLYANDTKLSSTAFIEENSTIRAVCKNGTPALWKNSMNDEEYTSCDNEYTFVLTGNSTLSFIGQKTAFSADCSALVEALAKANGFNSEDYSGQSYNNLITKVQQYGDYLYLSLPQEQIDDSVCDLLTAINDLVPCLNLSVKGENCSLNTNGGVVLFGDTVYLEAQPAEGYKFLYWYETNTKRIASTQAQYSFVMTANTSFKAICRKENFVTLRFESESSQVERIISKAPETWAKYTSLETFAPEVPYKYGYADGAWDYGDALQRLQSGQDAVVKPVYTEASPILPELPACTDIPAVSLTYSLDSENSIGSFLMAVNVPNGVFVQSIGTAFYYKEADSGFNPADFELTINNKMRTSKFEVPELPSRVYITNMHKLTSRYNWAVRGYVTYYDKAGVLRVAYSNQINISNREQI